jgi:hypothetical protein
MGDFQFMTDPIKLSSNCRKGCSELPYEDTFVPFNWYFQQASWIVNPRQSGSAAYNYALPLRIWGKLDENTLRCSLDDVVRRHNVLRSAFHIVDKQVIQNIVRSVPFHLQLTDLSNVAEPEREARVCKLVVEDATRPFDLTHAPLLRARLLRLGPEHHVLCLTTHRIVCDDWSTGILLNEISTIYGARISGNSACLPDLKFCYGDFVMQQRKNLQEKELDSRLSFWKKRLSGASDFYHVAADYPRPQSQTYRGSHEKLQLPSALLSAIDRLSRQERVSLFMTLVAGFMCLLYCYSGDEDIGMGSCVANRERAEVEGLIGAFSNALVLRTSFSGHPTFRELLCRVKEVSLEALSYQDFPFGDLVENLRPQRIPTRYPFFQTMFVLQNAPKAGWQFPGLTVQRFPVETGMTCYELNVWVTIREGLDVTLQYNTDIFKATTINKILRDYRSVIEKLVQDPAKRIDRCLI